KKIENKTGPYYWNHAIRAEFDAVDWFEGNDAVSTELQKMGFGMVLTHRNEGIAQGYGALIQLGVRENPIHATKLAAFYSFRKGNSPSSYPTSLVGSIALLRQALYDAQWHKEYGKTANYSLEALAIQEKLPAFFKLDNKHDLFR